MTVRCATLAGMCLAVQYRMLGLSSRSTSSSSQHLQQPWALSSRPPTVLSGTAYIGALKALDSFIQRYGCVQPVLFPS